MAFLAEPPAPERRQRSPIGLSLNFSSNNPFRNRAASPLQPPQPHSAGPYSSSFPRAPPPQSSQQRPMSRNPFLDVGEPDAAPARNKSVVANNIAVPDDLFSELSLLDRANTNEAVPRSMNNMPPPSSRNGLQQRPPGDDRRDHPRGPPPVRGPDSPEKREYRPRRASESSVMERERRPRMDRPMEARERTASEEARRRERRKEREERHRREKEKIRNGDKRQRKPQGLDIIDKLDVTGIYGQGLFHHDGPFDACNPHRNSKRDRRAPMQAFPVGSANMALGGAGPVSSRLDLDRFHGRGEESFMEFSTTKKVDTTVVDPTMRAEPVHGEESYGLGTSTFLEGAPASKNALQRRESEDPATQPVGLSRKKSIAQRFRGMSSARRVGSGDARSPETRYQQDADASPPNLPGKAISAGGPVRARYNKENEVNPFENDYEAAFEKKGTQIRIAEQERPSASRGRTSPNAPAGLTRSKTSDAADLPTRKANRSSNEDERQAPPVGGGFLSRMKSLKSKGPRRPRNEV